VDVREFTFALWQEHYQETLELGDILIGQALPPQDKLYVLSLQALAAHMLNQAERARRCFWAALNLLPEIGHLPQFGIFKSHFKTIGNILNSKPAPTTKGASAEAHEPNYTGLEALIKEHATLCRQGGALGFAIMHQGRILSEWNAPWHAGGVCTQSLMKSVTAIGVGLLVDREQISTADSLAQYIPELRHKPLGEVSVHELLTHTGGLPAWFDFSSRASLLQGALHHWEPQNRGQFIYGSVNPALLSCVAEQVCQRQLGKAFGTFLTEELLNSLGMSNSALSFLSDGLLMGYSSLRTTTQDLLKLGAMFTTKGRTEQKLLSTNWIDQMTSTQIDFSQSRVPLGAEGYGLLWWVLKEEKAIAALGQYDNVLLIYPEEELIVTRIQELPLSALCRAFKTPREDHHYVPTVFPLLRAIRAQLC